MRNFKFTKKMIFALLLVVMFLFASVSVYTVAAQAQNTRDLEIRLEQLNLPVQKVKLISHVPYEIEIDLLSQSEGDHILPDDILNMSLTRRQAKLSYRFGIRLDRYSLCLVNQEGIKISCEQSFMYADDLNQNLPVYTGDLDNEKAKDILSRELEFKNFEIIRFDVETAPEEGFKGQILTLEVSQRTIEEVNQSLPSLLDSIFFIEEQGNEKFDINLVLIHLRVIDSAGEILLDYVSDIETGTTNWTQKPGVYDGWFSQPMLESEKPVQIISTNPYPAPNINNEVNTRSSYPTPKQSEENEERQTYP